MTFKFDIISQFATKIIDKNKWYSLYKDVQKYIIMYTVIMLLSGEDNNYYGWNVILYTYIMCYDDYYTYTVCVVHTIM